MPTAARPHPTLLTVSHVPVVGMHGVHSDRETHILTMPTGEYVIRQDGPLWQVRHAKTLKLIYSGPGPVDVSISPAPF